MDERLLTADWIKKKWYFRNDNLRVGDVVVVIDPGTVRQQRNVGRIEQTYHCPDGLMRSRRKWYFRNDNLRVGDVVVVIDPGTVRRQWNVGRIEQTYHCPDGLMRVVDVWVMARPLSDQ